MSELPELPESWTSTRDALHAASRLPGAIRRALAPPHPRWWHVSLAVGERGPTTGPVAAPGGARLEITLDLVEHGLLVAVEGGAPALHPFAGTTATELGRRVLAQLAPLGVDRQVEADWRSDEPLRYDPEHGAAYREALAGVEEVFSRVREELPGERSPIQLWPHHFDLSWEWFSDRTVRHEEEGEMKESPAQIGFGWSPGDGGHPRPYFYANPWPFEETFAEGGLPDGARWHREGWSGGLLPYDVATEEGPELVAAFQRAVYGVAAPSLASGPDG